MVSPQKNVWAVWQELLSSEELEPMEVLKAAAMYERYFQEVQSHAVQVARAEGRSWQDIAEAAAVTKQTAWAKWRGSKSEARERPALFGEFPVQPPVQAAEVFDTMVVRAVESLVGEDDPIRDELLAAGRTALSDAVVAHGNAPKAVPFTVFASWWIRQAVIRRFYELHGRPGQVAG